MSKTSIYYWQLLLPLLLVSSHLYAHTPKNTTHEPEQQFNLTKIPNKPQSPLSIEKPTTQEMPNISSDELLSKPELLEHALYSSVVLNNIPAVDKLLPLYKTLPNATKDSASILLIQMSEALLAKNSGDLKQAISLYRSVLASHPEMFDIRLLLTEVLIADQQDEAAKDQLLRLRSEQQLSNHEHSVINNYLNILNKRSSWNLNGGISSSYDPNINNAPDKRSVDMNGGKWTFNQPESAHGISYFAEAKRDWNLKDNYYLSFSGDVYGKSYWTNHDYDDLIIQSNLGIKYKNARSELSFLPYYQKRWSGNEPYTYETGIGGEWSHWLTPKHQLLTAFSIGKETYNNNYKASGKTANASATWLFVNNARQYWTLGTDYAHKDAKDRSHAYYRSGIRASWTQEWQKGISTSLGIDVAKRHYQDKDIFGIQRQDNEYATRLSIWHRNIHFWGITPRLTMTYRTTDGNHPAYNYSKSGAIVQFNKRF